MEDSKFLCDASEAFNKLYYKQNCIIINILNEYPFEWPHISGAQSLTRVG